MMNQDERRIQKESRISGFPFVFGGL